MDGPRELLGVKFLTGLVDPGARVDPLDAVLGERNRAAAELVVFRLIAGFSPAKSYGFTDIEIGNGLLDDIDNGFDVAAFIGIDAEYGCLANGVEFKVCSSVIRTIFIILVELGNVPQIVLVDTPNAGLLCESAIK